MQKEISEKRMEELNKYAEKCKRINEATCWETDHEVAESLREIEKNLKNKKEDEQSF